jgi:uncharacterized protein YkwD
MYTLQILDRGQTFLHPLDGRPVLIGSGQEVDLRLGESEVLPEHARIEVVGSGIRIVAMAKLLVNGRATQRAELSLGDRIEIGRAVLVVGRSVARPGQPEDVLGDARSRTARRPKRRSSKLLPLLAAGALLAAVVVMVWNADPDAGRVQSEIALLQRTLGGGDLDRAKAQLTRLHREWSDAQDDRLQRLAGEEAHLLGIESAVQRLSDAVLDPAIVRNYSEWSLELQRLESEGEPMDRVAARIVRSSLRDTMSRRPESRRPELPVSPAVHAANGDAVASSLSSQKPVQKPVNSSAVSPDAVVPVNTAVKTDVPAVLAEAKRLAQQGLFAQGLAVVQAEIGEAIEPTVVRDLQAEVARLRGDAAAAAEKLAGEARELVKQGRSREAITLLATSQHRFPGTQECRVLAVTLGEVEAAVASAEREQMRQAVRTPEATVVDESARRATLATLRTQLDRIRDAEASGAFGEASKLLHEAAAMVRERDADFAARLEVRAADADQVAAWHAHVAKLVQGGAKLEVAMRTGRMATLKAGPADALVAMTVDGERPLLWSEVAAPGLQALIEVSRAQGTALLGGVTLLYKGGDTAVAEAVLAKALRADPKQKDAIDHAISRGRGEPWDPRGYTLAKEGFVSGRAVDTQKQAQKFAARLDALMRGKDVAARGAFVTEVMGQGPDALAALVAALQKEFGKQVAGLENGVLKKQVGKLAAQRGQLDQARKFAKDLIYDEVTYFYPYKPPAVSSDRFAEYNRVQAEVDRRVAAVETIWHDDRLRIKIPTSLQGDLDRLDWVAKVLGDFGQLDAASLAQVEWARALPPGDSIGIADYCATPTEREQLEEWRRIEAYNAVVEKDLSSAAREQLKITNAYRAMFRHRPLALVPKICDASQGHAEEMSRLGYFAHMSPTPGRRTPFDRMRLAGYDFGVSENIALHDSALGAHVAWCHSSGHHRNLLNPSHKEFGIGCDGRYWVQNFGSGSTYETHPAFGAGGLRTRPGHR